MILRSRFFSNETKFQILQLLSETIFVTTFTHILVIVFTTQKQLYVLVSQQKQQH